MNSVFANRQTISKQILHQDVKVVVVMCEVFLPTNTQTRAATVCLCVVAAVCQVEVHWGRHKLQTPVRRGCRPEGWKTAEKKMAREGGADWWPVAECFCGLMGTWNRAWFLPEFIIRSDPNHIFIRMFEKMISRLAWLEPRNSLNIHSFVALSCISKERTSLDKSGRRAVFRSLIKWSRAEVHYFVA